MTLLGAYEWLCNAVNGNYSNVPSPMAWGAIAFLVGYFRLNRLHAKLDHIILHHPDIPPFPGNA